MPAIEHYKENYAFISSHVSRLPISYRSMLEYILSDLNVKTSGDSEMISYVLSEWMINI